MSGARPMVSRRFLRHVDCQTVGLTDYLLRMIDILAIFAHRDDAELTCGGTLIKASRQGRRTAILDLTQGEMGTLGSAELRRQEAERAAEVMGCSARETLGLPDAGVENTPATREALARVI